MPGESMNTSLPESVAALLRTAGWHENRRVPVDVLHAELERAGCTLSTAAERFLTQFHGLRVETVHALRDFDVPAALRLLCTEDVRHLQQLVGESLCAIGYTADGTLFMTPAGRVVACSLDWTLLHVYENYQELLSVCTGETYNPPLYLTQSQLPAYLRNEDMESMK